MQHSLFASSFHPHAPATAAAAEHVSSGNSFLFFAPGDSIPPRCSAGTGAECKKKKRVALVSISSNAFSDTRDVITPAREREKERGKSHTKGSPVQE